MYVCTCVDISSNRRGRVATARPPARAVSLYKILFHFKALLWKPIIFLLPPSPAKPTLLQYYCTTIVRYTPPHRPPLLTPYTIQYRWKQYCVNASTSWPTPQNIHVRLYCALAPISTPPSRATNRLKRTLRFQFPSRTRD